MITIELEPYTEEQRNIVHWAAINAGFANVEIGDEPTLAAVYHYYKEETNVVCIFYVTF